MVKYVQCSTNYLIDHATNKFVPCSRRVNPCDVTVPFFLWMYPNEDEHTVCTGFINENGQLRNEYSTLRKSSIMELNSIEIKFIHGYRFATIRFLDRNKGTWTTIEVCADISESVSKYRGKQIRKMNGITYQFSIGDEIHSFYSGFTNPGEYFKSIPGLGRHEEPEAAPKNFLYGVSPAQYTVKYKGKVLNGSSLCMLCGPWAVLLGDDLSFDALVTLDGANPKSLSIQEIVYTTNVYLVKVKTLFK